MIETTCELCGENTADGRLDQASIVVATLYPTAAALHARGRRFPKGAALCQFCAEQTRPEAALIAQLTEHAACLLSTLEPELGLRALDLTAVARPTPTGGVCLDLVAPETARREGRVIHASSSGADVYSAVLELAERVRGAVGCACANCGRAAALTALRPYTLPEGWGRGERRVFRARTLACSICAEGLRDLEDWREAA